MSESVRLFDRQSMHCIYVGNPAAVQVSSEALYYLTPFGVDEERFFRLRAIEQYLFGDGIPASTLLPLLELNLCRERTRRGIWAEMGVGRMLEVLDFVKDRPDGWFFVRSEFYYEYSASGYTLPRFADGRYVARPERIGTAVFEAKDDD